MTVPDGYMENAQGDLVRLENISEVDKLKDELVKGLIVKAEAEEDRLRRLKAESLSDILAFQELVSEKYQAKLGGKEGNLSLKSFDGRLCVSIDVNKFLAIDEAQLHAAKALIDECLTEWAEDSRPELRQIITNAFNVDGEGRVNTKSILSLMKLKIEDPRWKRAMTALQDGLSVDGKKRYVRFRKREGADEKMQTISLDIAKL